MAETFLYMTTIGHKSGKPHRIEIWYVPYQGCYYLCSEKREEAHWVQNIQQTPQVTFCIAEREQPVPEQSGTASMVTDPATIHAVAALFHEKYQWNDGLFVRVCPLEMAAG